MLSDRELGDLCDSRTRRHHRRSLLTLGSCDSCEREKKTNLGDPFPAELTMTF
jgi:hypothetical protein